MDHDEVREALELAAAEPAGIERLMAGDTPTAASVAAHLVGCPACTEELGRLRRASLVIGDAIRTTAPPDLRARTLAYVAEYGRVPAANVPSAAGPVAPTPISSAPAGATPSVAPATAGSTADTGRRMRRLGWLAGMAAALVAALFGTSLVLDARYGDQLARQEARAAGLSRVTAAAVALHAQPDVTTVTLAATPVSPTSEVSGTLAYSPGTSDLVVIASGLTEPAPGREYRCWLEVNGARTRVGRMFFGGELAFWAGRVDSVADLAPGTTFGVSLVDAAGDSLDGQPVLLGTVSD